MQCNIFRGSRYNSMIFWLSATNAALCYTPGLYFLGWPICWTTPKNGMGVNTIYVYLYHFIYIYIYISYIVVLLYLSSMDVHQELVHPQCVTTQYPEQVRNDAMYVASGQMAARPVKPQTIPDGLMGCFWWPMVNPQVELSHIYFQFPFDVTQNVMYVARSTYL